MSSFWLAFSGCRTVGLAIAPFIRIGGRNYVWWKSLRRAGGGILMVRLVEGMSLGDRSVSDTVRAEEKVDPAHGVGGSARRVDGARSLSLPQYERSEFIPLVVDERGVAEEQPAFWPVERTTVRPYPVSLLEGVGPPVVDAADMYGSSLLRIWVDQTGGVAEVEVQQSDMPEPLLKASVNAFKAMRFMPAQLDGRPVGSVMTVVVHAEDFALPMQ